MTLSAVNPSTGETIKTYEEMTPTEVKRVISQAHETFGTGSTPPLQNGRG